MNKDQIAGRVEWIVGLITEMVGTVMQEKRVIAEGNAKRLAGTVQARAGDERASAISDTNKITDKL